MRTKYTLNYTFNNRTANDILTNTHIHANYHTHKKHDQLLERYKNAWMRPPCIIFTMALQDKIYRLRAPKRKQTKTTLSGNYLIIRIGITFALISCHIAYTYTQCAIALDFDYNMQLRGMFGAFIPLICPYKTMWQQWPDEVEWERERESNKRMATYRKQYKFARPARAINRGMLLTRDYLMFKVIVDATNQKWYEIHQPNWLIVIFLCERETGRERERAGADTEEDLNGIMRWWSAWCGKIEERPILWKKLSLLKQIARTEYGEEKWSKSMDRLTQHTYYIHTIKKDGRT